MGELITYLIIRTSSWLVTLATLNIIYKQSKVAAEWVNSSRGCRSILQVLRLISHVLVIVRF